MLAVEKGNLAALKVLYKNGADINHANSKNGFTALRIAIENQNLEVLKYILSLDDMNPMIPDFNQNTPLMAAYRGEFSKEIMEVIDKFKVRRRL